ncbi:MAG TPA: hypothetical protein VIT67_07755 [Povalibacter sp.]
MSTATSIQPLVDWHRAPVAIHPLARSAEAPVHVSLVRGINKRGQRDRFVCDLTAWDLLLEVAVSFGWKQRGTTYTVAGLPATNHPGAAEVARHNYHPGDSRDPKCVDNVDAIAWAAALSAAHRSPHLAGMLEATLTTASERSGLRWAALHNSPFVIVMAGFTAYAFSGAFEFARADAL